MQAHGRPFPHIDSHFDSRRRSLYVSSSPLPAPLIFLACFSTALYRPYLISLWLSVCYLPRRIVASHAKMYRATISPRVIAAMANARPHAGVTLAPCRAGVPLTLKQEHTVTPCKRFCLLARCASTLPLDTGRARAFGMISPILDSTPKCTITHVRPQIQAYLASRRAASYFSAFSRDYI